MAYNKAKEERKWLKQKEQEEALMRALNVAEIIISELRQYDWMVFKSDRNFYEHQFTNNDLIDYIGSKNIELPIDNYQSLLNQIETDELYKALKELSQEEIKIIFYRFSGYTNHEIALILNIHESSVSRKITKIKKKINFFLKTCKI